MYYFRIEVDKISYKFSYSISKKIFNWFLNLNIPSLKENTRNEILNLFTEDINSIRFIFKTYLGIGIEFFLTTIGAIIMSLVFDWRIGLVCTAAIVIIFLFSVVFMILNKKLVTDTVTFDYFSESIANIKLIKAFNLKQNLVNFIIEQEKKIRTRNTVFNHPLHIIINGTLNILLFAIIASLNLIGGIFVIEQKVSTISSFTGSCSLLSITLMILLLVEQNIIDFVFLTISMGRLNHLVGENFKDFNSEETKILAKNKNSNNSKKAENIDKLNKKNENKNGDEKAAAYEKPLIILGDIEGKNIPSKEIKGNIEFKNVSFSYSQDSQTKVLNNVSFIIHAGSKVGFVGPSGSGKSTIIQLLLRFFEPSEGEIFLDNINIKNYKPKNLRDLFSGVFQEPDLFERTIYENILYGNLNANEEEIASAALIAQVPLKLLKQSTNQSINEISGGQKQRIAIARCLLKQRNIYFFDEATSALDVNTEKKIAINLDWYFQNLKEAKTQLLVVHR